MSSLYKRGKIWYIEGNFNGVRLKRAIGEMTKREAERHQLRIEREFAEIKEVAFCEFLTLADLYTAYVEYARQIYHQPGTLAGVLKAMSAIEGNPLPAKSFGPVALKNIRQQ